MCIFNEWRRRKNQIATDSKNIFNIQLKLFYPILTMKLSYVCYGDVSDKKKIFALYAWLIVVDRIYDNIVFFLTFNSNLKIYIYIKTGGYKKYVIFLTL